MCGFGFCALVPWAVSSIVQGCEACFLVITVHVILGPLPAFAIFNPAKGWPVLRLDLTAIAMLQLAALGYGLATVYQARPAALVFEKDRFRVISAVDVPRAGTREGAR